MPRKLTTKAIGDGEVHAVDIGALNDDLVFSGAAGSNATIGKNQSSGRDELQIYSGGDAYQANSSGAGIHLYGNSDNEHSGNFAVLTGPNGNGDGRLIVSGRQDKANVTIGNSIWDYVDDGNDHALLNLKGPTDQPALLIEGASGTEGDIVTVDGEAMQFGHWNKSTSTFTERMAIQSSGDIKLDTNTLVVDATNNRVGILDASPDSSLHVSGNVKVGSAASSAWAASSHDAGGLDVFVGSGSHALQLWDDNYQSRPRFEVARDGHVWAGQNMQFHENNTSTTAPFNITNSSSTQNFFNITTYGSGSVNETYRHCYNINADAHWVHFTGGGGNTVFTTTAYIGGEHYKDITVWTITQYYSDLKIKVVQDNGSNKSIWVAGNTYQNNVYNLQWRVTPIRPCSIEHNPSSSQSAVHMVHHASGGEQFTSTSGASAGSGPSTY